MIGSWWCLLADAEKVVGKVGEKVPTDPANQGGNLFSIFAPIVMIFVLFYLILWRPEKRRQADLKSQLGSLKKNDRVLTVGGIYGVVTNVQRDTERVTLRIDESNNTKVEVALSAISRVVGDQPAEEKPT